MATDCGEGSTEQKGIGMWGGLREGCSRPGRGSGKGPGGSLAGRLGVVLAQDPGVGGCWQWPGAPSGQDTAPGGVCSERPLRCLRRDAGAGEGGGCPEPVC